MDIAEESTVVEDESEVLILTTNIEWSEVLADSYSLVLKNMMFPESEEISIDREDADSMNETEFNVSLPLNLTSGFYYLVFKNEEGYSGEKVYIERYFGAR